MKALTFTVLIITTIILVTGFSGGPGSSGGLAVTTAPGESGQFCGSGNCHAGGAFNQTTIIEISDENGDMITEYLPNTQYQVSVIINATEGEPTAYGFQMVALNDVDNTDAGGWNESGVSGVQSVTLLERKYLEHLGPQNSDNTFKIPWTSPDFNTGPITFYAAGNAVNRNGGNSGDGADTVRVTLPEAIISSIDQRDIVENALRLFPNPAKDELHIQLESNTNGSLLEIINFAGQKLIQQRMESRETSLKISDLTPGMYILRVYTHAGNEQIFKKFIVE